MGEVLRNLWGDFAEPSGTSSVLSRRPGSVVSATLALILSSIVAILYLPGMGVNSDVLVPEMMYRDLFVLHTPLDGWNFSSALFMFPDWVFYFLCRSLSSNVSLVFWMYATLQMWLLYWFISLLRPQQSLILFAVWSIVLVALFPVEWMVFLWPVYHGGAMLMGLYFAYWFLQNPYMGRPLTVFFGVAAGLTLASDLFFGLQTLLPLGLLSLVAWQQRKLSFFAIVKQGLFGLAIGALASLASHGVFAWMHSKPLNFTYIHWQFQWHKVIDIAVYLINYKVAFLLFVFAFWKAWIDRQKTPVYSWLMLSLAINLVFVLLADLWLDKLTVRYFLFFPVLVSLVLAGEIVDLLSNPLPQVRNWGLGLVALACLGTLAPVFGTVGEWPGRSVLQNPYPAEVACFDQWQARYGLQDGIADFWLAKTIPLFSKSHPNLFPMRDDPGEFKWLNNSRWYDGVTSRSYVLYDDHDGRPSPSMVLKKWGPPVKKDHCGAFELWLYDKNLAIR